MVDDHSRIGLVGPNRSGKSTLLRVPAGADAQARLEAAADAVVLDRTLLDRPLSALSGGQAARAGLAVLLTARFDVLLLDEPTSHLDDERLAILVTLLSDREGGS